MLTFFELFLRLEPLLQTRDPYVARVASAATGRY
jgi:hypothetical protein